MGETRVGDLDIALDNMMGKEFAEKVNEYPWKFQFFLQPKKSFDIWLGILLITNKKPTKLELSNQIQINPNIWKQQPCIYLIGG